MKRELKVKPISECRCNERLKTKTEESTRLVYTGLFGELEHLKIKTRLIDEKCASVMGECDLDLMGDPSKLRLTCKSVALVRVRLTLFLKMQKSGRFPDEPVRIKVTRIYYVTSQTY